MLTSVVPYFSTNIARAISLQDPSANRRIILLRASLDSINDNPLLGSGPGSFQHQIMTYYDVYAYLPNASNGMSAHNDWTNLMVEIGALGAGTFLLLLILYARIIYISERKIERNNPLWFILSGLIGSLIGAGIDSLFHEELNYNLLWFVVALTLVVVKLINHKYPCPDQIMLENNSKLIAPRVGYKSPKRYNTRANFVFKDICLKGARVLDIGCGTGALALWAAINGAGYVLGLEPESDGSIAGSLQQFQRTITDLNLGAIVEASPCSLHKIIGIEPFDLVILYNVINHLDEPAVQQLPGDLIAVRKYLAIIDDLKSLLNEGGTIILADCAHDNLWGNLGLPSPVAPTIEWKKHKNPELWLDLFSRKGFYLKDLRWSPVHPFGLLSQNRLFHYFTLSHFVLRMRI